MPYVRTRPAPLHPPPYASQGHLILPPQLGQESPEQLRLRHQIMSLAGASLFVYAGRRGMIDEGLPLEEGARRDEHSPGEALEP
jgi:hypothetical protein